MLARTRQGHTVVAVEQLDQGVGIGDRGRLVAETSSTSCAARTKLTTESPIPAAVSTTRTSRLSLISLNAWISPHAAWARGAPCSACRRPRERCARRRDREGGHRAVRSVPRSRRPGALGVSPSRTSTLARPRSASSSMTRRPRSARASARFTDTLVLPTPPLPPVTAITCTGCIPICFIPCVVVFPERPFQRSRYWRERCAIVPGPAEATFASVTAPRAVLPVLSRHAAPVAGRAGEHLGHGVLAGLFRCLQAHRPADQLVTARHLQVVESAAHPPDRLPGDAGR